MINQYLETTGYHAQADAKLVDAYELAKTEVIHDYRFENFFHPYLDELVEKLNRGSLAELLSPQTQALEGPFFAGTYQVAAKVTATSFPAQIDESAHGPYAGYNWELFYHLPVAVATSLSKAQRFAEAQRWFHFVFDPTATDRLPGSARFWRFLLFRTPRRGDNIRELLELLASPSGELTAEDKQARKDIQNGYAMMLAHPFHPHAIARTRPLAYQYSVVMKYLDNLISWGDSLFRQDTIESINEATQRYVMAANLLGPRPQKLPQMGRIRTRTYAQLKAAGLDATRNAWVAMEGEFPLNLAPSPASGGESNPALFGIGRALYFCVPDNDRLMGYWDTVADRLYKIRNCLNISGVFRQLALFDPPLDPGMLVKAAAAGLDVSALLAGGRQPAGPQRALPLLQKSLELAGEVKALGSQLLGVLEKADAEKMTMLRQTHESQLQQLAKDVRFLQWKNAEAATASLVRSRQTVFNRYAYYARLLGQQLDENTPEVLEPDRRPLTEDNFDEAYAALVERFDHETPGLGFPPLKQPPNPPVTRDDNGSLYLTQTEADEVSGLQTARTLRLAAGISETIAGVLTFIPEFNVNLHFWGMGASSTVAGGSKLSDAAQIAAKILNTSAGFIGEGASLAGKSATYERRADEWIQQFNQAGRELSQYGRQVIGSLITEQVARLEYRNLNAQIANTTELGDFMATKFTQTELYAWLGSELSRQHSEWYRFAVDYARRTEASIKAQLRRPELDAVSFIGFNHWDVGRKGLLAGERLYADVKRLELAYADNNRRELELTRHVSLRQLDALALLRLKTEGSATFSVPEWLFDRDYPGHYLRRLRQVSVSAPGVVGPFTPLPLQLSLQRSSVRTSALLTDGGYSRTGPQDGRFVDLFGPLDQIAASSGVQDYGMFEPNPHDERLLPFEGAGAVSTWTVELPRTLRGFDYSTISDVVLHLRYTARQGGTQLGDTAVSELTNAIADLGSSPFGLLFNLRQDFPTAWAAFVAGAGPLQVELSHGQLPYIAQSRTVEVAGDLELFAGQTTLATRRIPTPAGLGDNLNAGNPVTLELAADTNVLTRQSRDVYLIMRYALS